MVFITGLVGPFGTPALAGYGMGARLEYLQIPLVFGMGSALVRHGGHQCRRGTDRPRGAGGLDRSGHRRRA